MGTGLEGYGCQMCWASVELRCYGFMPWDFLKPQAEAALEAQRGEDGPGSAVIQFTGAAHLGQEVCDMRATCLTW